MTPVILFGIACVACGVAIGYWFGSRRDSRVIIVRSILTFLTAYCTWQSADLIIKWSVHSPEEGQIELLRPESWVEALVIIIGLLIVGAVAIFARPKTEPVPVPVPVPPAPKPPEDLLDHFLYLIRCRLEALSNNSPLPVPMTKAITVILAGTTSSHDIKKQSGCNHEQYTQIVFAFRYVRQQWTAFSQTLPAHP
jgi:hypothetical protein